MPQYKREPRPEDVPRSVEPPTLKLCQLADNKLILPKDTRQLFLHDPVFAPEWRQLLNEFDKTWGTPVAAVSGNTTSPMKSETESPLKPKVESDSFAWASCFPDACTSLEKLKELCGDGLTEMAGPNSSVSFILGPGPSLYVACKEAVELRQQEDGAIISHGAGSWLVGDKAKKFMGASPGKALQCAWQSDEVPVVLEELVWVKFSLHFDSISSRLDIFSHQEEGSDSQVMTLRAALQYLERGGMVEYSVGGHVCHRPPEVQQGRADDHFDVTVEADNPLVWRATVVQSKNLKISNVASAFAFTQLQQSPLVLAPCLCLSAVDVIF